MVPLLNLEIEHEVDLDFFGIKFVLVFETEFVFVEPIVDLVCLRAKDVALELHVVFFESLWTTLSAKTPVAILIISTSGIKLKADLMLGQLLGVSD